MARMTGESLFAQDIRQRQASALMRDTCPDCGSFEITAFYEVRNVPVHSVVLVRTQEAAVNYPQGHIVLAHCRSCGFIFNATFDACKVDYSSDYEATQGFSPTFTAFHHRLANLLISRFELHNKDIIEIGCGQGEFLTVLCALGNNRGIGFDPAYDSDRAPSSNERSLRIIKDYYSEKYADYQADFMCCKMTLEHIDRTKHFVQSIRQSLQDRFETVVFFQVPDITRILRELAFWDIYYEHCSYFTAGSLAHLFELSGFEVTDLWKDYGDQYLMLAARPCGETPRLNISHAGHHEKTVQDVSCFERNCDVKLDLWRQELAKLSRSGSKTVLWGGGSKAVAFLTTLKIQKEIQYVVDVNPYKHGTYLPGTGQKVVPPEFLREYRPDIVVAMNPIYSGEIQQALDSMQTTAELVPI